MCYHGKEIEHMNVLEGERDVGIHRNSYDCRCVHAICTISTEDRRESNAVCYDGGHGIGFPTSRARELILQQDLFAGALGWAFRGVMAVALVLLCMAYYRERKKDNSEG